MFEKQIFIVIRDYNGDRCVLGAFLYREEAERFVARQHFRCWVECWEGCRKIY